MLSWLRCALTRYAHAAKQMLICVNFAPGQAFHYHGTPRSPVIDVLQRTTVEGEPSMDIEQMHAVATRMVAPGKGILAADESSGTIAKRFAAIGVESTPDSRRDYREMLFRATEAMQSFISGVILFDETIRQQAKDGTLLIGLIEKAGSIPGIKVDNGAKPLALAPGERVTEGLDGLRERLVEYHRLGARFAKWRAVIDIGRGGDASIPSIYCVQANADALARYAALCQEQNLVPIVEPEVLMDGDHDIQRCFEVTEVTLRTVFAQLYLHRVQLEGLILKPNMVVPGKKAAKQALPEEVAEMTIKCLRRTVPSALPGIVFLSGGQSDEEATANLHAINAQKSELPWHVSFSYGRALQTAPLEAWHGKAENERAAQKAFIHRSRMNSLAQEGKWSSTLERDG
jgi:fructose-bisphosphate aldolase class I